jgi:2-polyprenyl-3-methyl-5-hydroxy-6-metoxy-1,4-benzoquinol methylase
MGPYYVNEQYDVPVDMASFDARAHSQRWKVDLVKGFASGGDLLVIGPATGEFSYAAQKAGFRATMLEMDEQCCRFIKDVLRMEVQRTADPASALGQLGMFDVVCIWQAIEHIPHFWTVLTRSVEVLRPNGVILVSTPNPNAFQARILRRFWPHLDAPRHLYLIPQTWMQAFAQKVGASVVLNTTRDVGSLGLNYYGWYLAVRNVCRGKVTSRAIDRVAQRTANLFRRWEAIEGKGSSYTMALRKAGL